MLIREILSESKKKRDTQPETKISIKPVLASTFRASFDANVKQTPNRDTITNNLIRFINEKMQKPFLAYPGMDLDFDSDNPYALKKIRHAKMGFDHRLFYALHREDSVVYLVLFGIFTHDASGIGTRQNRNLQKSLADQFDRARQNVSSYQPFGK